MDGRGDASGGRGQGEQHEREDRLPGVHHQHVQTGGRVSECRYKFRFNVFILLMVTQIHCIFFYREL